MMFLALMSKWMRPKQGLFCHGEGLSQQQQDQGAATNYTNFTNLSTKSLWRCV